jgi:hypothetical protein
MCMSDHYISIYSNVLRFHAAVWCGSACTTVHNRLRGATGMAEWSVTDMRDPPSNQLYYADRWWWTSPQIVGHYDGSLLLDYARAIILIGYGMEEESVLRWPMDCWWRWEAGPEKQKKTEWLKIDNLINTNQRSNVLRGRSRWNCYHRYILLHQFLSSVFVPVIDNEYHQESRL